MQKDGENQMEKVVMIFMLVCSFPASGKHFWTKYGHKVKVVNKCHGSSLCVTVIEDGEASVCDSLFLFLSAAARWTSLMIML